MEGKMIEYKEIFNRVDRRYEFSFRHQSLNSKNLTMMMQLEQNLIFSDKFKFIFFRTN